MTARIRLVLSVLAVVAVLLVGTAGYMAIEVESGVGFLDALFMTVITVSTVGYDEVWPLSPASRVWTIGVIAVGIGTVSYAFTSLVTVVVSDEFRSLRERKKMDQTIDQMKDHTIVCGFGRMGRLIAEELVRRRVAVLVIERDRELESPLREAGFPFLLDDATEEEALLKAGLLHARALVLVIPSDADNVYITLTAHTLRSDLTIVARAEQPSAEVKLKRAGATRVVCPPVTGAATIANILTRPTFVDFVELAQAGVDLEIDEYVVGEHSPLVGRSLRATHVRRETGAMVVAIKPAAGQAIINPDPDAVLSAGDRLILVGPTGISTRLEAIGSTS